MEIKVEQWKDKWLRFKDGKIIFAKQIEKHGDEEGIFYVVNLTYSFDEFTEQPLIANTPQELVQVGDLIVLQNGSIVEVLDIGNKVIRLTDTIIGLIDDREITKILTPKGKDYICQWEDNNE